MKLYDRYMIYLTKRAMKDWKCAERWLTFRYPFKFNSFATKASLYANLLLFGLVSFVYNYTGRYFGIYHTRPEDFK